MEYQIGNFSKISRLSIKTLRYYHEYGILSPVKIDDITGYRYYDEKSVENAGIIRVLKDFNFSLKEIKEILDSYSEDEQISGYLIKKKKEIEEKIDNFKTINKRIKQFIMDQEEIKTTNYSNNIIIKDIPDTIIAGIRYKGRYNETGKYIRTLINNCGRHIKGKPFNLYYDGEYKDEEADIETCFEVKTKMNTECIDSRLLKGGKSITLIHSGSHEKLGDSYRMIIDFINKGNFNTDLPIREKYIRGPGMVFKGNPKNYITEI